MRAFDFRRMRAPRLAVLAAVLFAAPAAPGRSEAPEASGPRAQRTPVAAASKKSPAAKTDRDLLTTDLDAILERFDRAQAATSTLTAKFVQRRKVSLLGSVQESSGKLYYTKPDRFLWRHEKPDERILCISGDTFTNWYKDLKRATVADISRQRRRVFKYFAIGERAAALRENFIVTVGSSSDLPDTVHLELIPKRKRVRDRIERMDMWISKTVWLPVQIRYAEPGGDFTQFTFSDLKPNAVIPDATYGVEIPPDVKVDRSFGPEPDAVPGAAHSSP